MVQDGLTTDAVLLGEGVDVATGDDEAPMGRLGMKMVLDPGLEPTELTDAL